MQLLVIKINNGHLEENPMLFSNLKDFYPDADYNNLPEGYMKFVEEPMPILGPYEVYERSGLIRESDYIKRIHYVRGMTPQEKNEKILLEKSKPKPFPSWVWSEELCSWVSPIPIPTEEYAELLRSDPLLKVRWDESSLRYLYYY